MSNRRFIIVFLVGIAVAGLILAIHSLRSGQDASIGRTAVTAPFGPDEADRIEIVRQTPHTNRLERTAQGVWRLTYPFPASADAVAVAKLLDAMLLFKPGDMLTPSDMRSLGRSARDFGLVPPKLTVSVASGARKMTLEFGGNTPSGAEVYARSGASGPVFTVPAATFAAVPADMDAFRRRRIFETPLASVVAADFRVPGSTFVKLVHSGASWQIVQPDKAPADAAAVNDVLSRLLALRAEKCGIRHVPYAEVLVCFHAGRGPGDPAQGHVPPVRH